MASCVRGRIALPFCNIITQKLCCTQQSQGFLAAAWCIQTRGAKKKFVMPANMKPLNFDHSEDLVGQEKLKPSDILFKYRDIPEVYEFPESIRKLFTVEFASGREILEHRHMLMQDKIGSYVGPGNSYERQVAYLTVKIRNLIPTIIGDRRDKLHKSYLLERIAQRKKILGYLRQLDYDRYLWLLKELKITNTLMKPGDKYKLSRRAQIKKKVREEAIQLKREKTEEVKQMFEQEKLNYMKEKEATLKKIDVEIEEFGLNKEEILKSFYMEMDEKRANAMKPKNVRTVNKKYDDYKAMKKEKRRKEREIIH